MIDVKANPLFAQSLFYKTACSFQFCSLLWNFLIFNNTGHNKRSKDQLDFISISTVSKYFFLTIFFSSLVYRLEKRRIREVTMLYGMATLLQWTKCPSRPELSSPSRIRFRASIRLKDLCKYLSADLMFRVSKSL